MQPAALACIPRRRLLSALAAGWVLSTGAACASTPAYGPATLDIVDRDAGRELPRYLHAGRSWVPGRPGARYALRLRNTGPGRVLVVLSVDGVNVITGQTADWDQAGYVIEPGGSHDITGWRKSDTEVAAFEFAALQQSYAARTGRPDHVGVIGMAVFRERTVPQHPPAVAMAPPPAAAARDNNAAAESSGAEAAAGATRPAARLGTAHGQREWSVTRRTAFERAGSRPDQLVRIEYDSLERLVAAGIVPPPRHPAGPWPRPSPFPGNPMAYVPDPPRW